MATLAPTYGQVFLSVKYTSVLFPFDTVQFLRVLSKQGFIIPESLGPAPFGSRIEVSGIVARKGEVSIRIDVDKQVVGVHAPDMTTLLEEMDSVESLLKKELDLDSSSLAYYYEFMVSLTVRAGSNPLESWYAHFAQAPVMKKFSEVLGTEVSPFGIRLAITKEVPNQSSWLDVRIEPLIQSPKNHYYVEAIFRRPRRDDVFAFVRKFEETLRALLLTVEQG